MMVKGCPHLIYVRPCLAILVFYQNIGSDVMRSVTERVPDISSLFVLPLQGGLISILFSLVFIGNTNIAVISR